MSLGAVPSYPTMSFEGRIARAVETLDGLLEGLPSEALYREPAAGEWPVMSTLAHVVEMLPYWAEQCPAIVRSPGAPFGRTHDDPGRLGAIAAHANDPVETARRSIRASADSAIVTLRAIPREQWSLSGEHPRRGAMSIEQVVDDFVTGHLESHVQQVREALQVRDARQQARGLRPQWLRDKTGHQSLGYSPSQVP